MTSHMFWKQILFLNIIISFFTYKLLTTDTYFRDKNLLHCIQDEIMIKIMYQKFMYIFTLYCH
jgi:hypothetical protein